MAHCWVPTLPMGTHSQARGTSWSCAKCTTYSCVTSVQRGPVCYSNKGLRRQVERCLSYRSPLPESPSASFPVVLLIFFSAALNNHHGDWILALFCFVFGHPSLLEGILSSSVPHPQACAGREAMTIAFPRPFAQV